AGSARVGTDYNVVSVLGSQGSGSSTLLNDIFGTSFSIGGSQCEQTTKAGIQTSWCSDARVLLLDGRGWTGSPNTGVEQKITQFVTVTSDIVLLNLKQDEITRHASQYRQMMETVCRTALERYDEEDTHRKTTMLLCVIRDWDGSMDIESAIARLTKGLLSIWTAAAENAGNPAASFSDFFRLGMITLPHKNYVTDGYHEQVSILRERFKVVAEDSLVSAQTRADVPICDLMGHLSSVWKTIRGVVNVSSERRTIAEKVCPVFVDSALDLATRSIKGKVDVNLPGEEFNGVSEATREEILAHFDRLAKPYESIVVLAHRTKVMGAVDAALSERYLEHVAGLRGIALNEFSQRLVLLQKTTYPMPPLSSQVLFPKIDDLKEDCLGVFKTMSEAARFNLDWSYQKEEALFVAGMDALIEPVKERQAAIDLSLERSLAIFSPIGAKPLADMSKLLTDSAGLGRMMVAALFSRS
ncbi:hypothetical protein M408DRAFT_80996, partial [Serendipita vermifera MAFF 305830]